MSFWRSRRIWLLGGASLVLILLLWRPGADRFRSRLEQSLGSALGHKVEIGNVSLKILPRPGFNLSQFLVRDDLQFSAEPILRADEVSATLHPSSLWRWRIEIATLSFKDASLNLVRRSDGRWNLEPILERAAHAPAAPTGNARSEVRRRFPYIEVTNGRVNLKLGAEKMPYALTDADLALWLESNDAWGVRLRGQPVRTDMRLSDTGILRANGTWRRADDLHKTPLRLSAAYEGAQLGQLTKLVYGADKGWRGTVSASANFTGSAEDLHIQSDASVDNFRRYDLVTAPSLRLSTRCTGRYNNWPRQLSEVLCTSPAQDGTLQLRGNIGLAKPRAYVLTLAAEKYPAQRLAEVLHGVKKGLPEDFSATGTVSGDIAFHADGAGTVAWSGSGNTERLTLRAAALQTIDGNAILFLGSVPFRTRSVVAGARVMHTARPADGNSQRAVVDLFQSDNALEIGPVTLDLAKTFQADFHAWFSATGYRASLAGEAPIQRLLQIARAAGVTAVHPALEGGTTFDWQATGTWSGFAPPQTTGTIHLRGARAEFPGLNAPVAIAAADLTLTPDTLELEKLSATAGGSRWTGSISRPRLCPGSGTCPVTVDLRTDEVSIEKLNLLLNPNIHKQPWYRILTGTPQQAGSVLRTLGAEGTLHADRLIADDIEVNAVTVALKLENGHLQLSDFRGSVLGGRHVGAWQADFTKDTPEYTVTGRFEDVSLLQLGKVMRNNWITGTSSGSYEMDFSGWSAADLQATSHGIFTLDARDGTVTHFGPAASPLKFNHVRVTLIAGKSLAVISQGKLENPQGIYDISGVASFGHRLDLRFLRKGNRGFAVTGALEDPHVESVSAAAPSKSSE